jgi:hypothetical protein
MNNSKFRHLGAVIALTMVIGSGVLANPAGAVGHRVGSSRASAHRSVVSHYWIGPDEGGYIDLPGNCISCPGYNP